MDTEEYKKLWKEAIQLCEIEPNEDVAMVFIKYYCSSLGNSMYASMDNEELLLTFVKLVVYEQKFHMKFGSTTPAAFCYQELLARADSGRMDRVFVYDVGDWAADYSDNDYVPMGNCRGYGPRRYFKFLEDYEARVWEEKEFARIRKEELLAEGRKKVQEAKRRHQKRLDTIQQLREKSINECISIIDQSGKSVYYYYELIEEWFINGSLNKDQKAKIMSLFPDKSTRHNIRKRKSLEKI
jgi:hypothetical protein